MWRRWRLYCLMCLTVANIQLINKQMLSKVVGHNQMGPKLLFMITLIRSRVLQSTKGFNRLLSCKPKGKEYRKGETLLSGCTCLILSCSLCISTFPFGFIIIRITAMNVEADASEHSPTPSQNRTNDDCIGPTDREWIYALEKKHPRLEVVQCFSSWCASKRLEVEATLAKRIYFSQAVGPELQRVVRWR